SHRRHCGRASTACYQHQGNGRTGGARICRPAGPALRLSCCVKVHHGNTGTQRTARGSTQYGGTELARTLFEKIWDNHVFCPGSEGSSILYIDLHLVHEVTSPQAFEGLRIAGRRVRRPELTFATMDHNVPTTRETRSIS